MSYLPSYPLAELHQARNTFVVQWYKAIHRDPWVQMVHDWHFRFPPAVRMLNCTEYPFASEDKVYRMPALPKPDPTTPSVSKPPSSLHRNARFDKDCKALTESILSDPVHPVTPSVGPPLYICDNCPFETRMRSNAETHLKEAAHTSCSQYVFVTNHSESAEDSTDPPTISLCQARVLYNASVPGLAWLSEHTAIVCPSCFAVFPDKLMCAYHHQSQHPGHSAKFSYGSVLKFGDLDVTLPPTCTHCKQQFNETHSLVDHWVTRGDKCPSPFLPVTLTSVDKHPVHVVQVYCHTCRAYFDRILSTANDTSHMVPVGTKRKRPGYDFQNDVDLDSANSSDHSGLVGFARFCLNHASLHLTGWHSQSAVCKLSIRFVQTDKSNSKTLPAYLNDSDKSLLLFLIHECKRMLTYLDHLRTGRRNLHRRAKVELKRLLSLVETYSS